MVKALHIVCLMGIAAGAIAQDVKVRGRFAADSAALGEVIPYVLTASYPRNVQILFPDSTFSFAPFEGVGKRFFPTRSNDEISRDSVVYYLSAFELDSVQRLRIPIFVLQARDCLTVFPEPDSLAIRFRVAMALDSIPVEKLPLKANTAYQRVRQLFNYPVLLIGLGILAVAATITWIVFGKRIRRYFLLRSMKRKYQSFLQRFGEAVNRVGADASSRVAAEALWLWKKYMEDLENYPFTKSTSREILKKFTNDRLGNALRTIDRGIYGGYGATPEPFLFLKDYSRQQFERRESEVKHG